MGAYKTALERNRTGMAPEQIHRNKSQAKHERRIALKEQNLAEQAERQANKRTPEEQLAVLDARLGKDVGAKRERKRLKEKIAKK